MPLTTPDPDRNLFRSGDRYGWRCLLCDVESVGAYTMASAAEHFDYHAAKVKHRRQATKRDALAYLAELTEQGPGAIIAAAAGLAHELAAMPLPAVPEHLMELATGWPGCVQINAPLHSRAVGRVRGSGYHVWAEGNADGRSWVVVWPRRPTGA